MSIYELNKNQIIQLKQQYICEQNELSGQCTYWSDMANADSIVPDSVIYSYYGGIRFSKEDFT